MPHVSSNGSQALDVQRSGREPDPASDILARGTNWLRILKKHDGIAQAWLGLIDAKGSIAWKADRHSGQMPSQFSAPTVQDVIRRGKPFTFRDHGELVSGGLFPISHGGRVVGLVALLSEQSDYFKPDAVGWISALIEIITTELVPGKRVGQMRDDEYNISRLMQATLDVRDALPALFEILVDLLEADAFTVLHYLPSSGQLELLGTHGLEAASLAKLNFKIDAGMVGGFINARQPLWIEDLQAPFMQDQPINRLDEEGFRGYLALPLLAHDVPVGAMEIAWRSPRQSNAWRMDLLQGIADQVAYAMERTYTVRDLRLENAQLITRYNAMIEGLSRALELRDLETVGHTRRVSTWTMRLIEHMPMSPEEREAVKQGALLHDIGKLGIPDAILLKPGSLTPQERRVMEQHVVYGYNILAPVTQMRHTLDITLYHHERWDGKGYPHALTREQIPIMARLFAVVDVFDALTSDRPYRTAWSHSQAIEYLRQESGRQFDPEVVELFLTVMKKWRG